MIKFINTNVGRLRALGFIEGMSFIILVFIGMPMKYYFDDPSVVKSFGMVHGFLFMAFVFESVRVSIVKDWSTLKVMLPLVLSSVVPFGTFIAEYKLLKDLQD